MDPVHIVCRGKVLSAIGQSKVCTKQRSKLESTRISYITPKSQRHVLKVLVGMLDTLEFSAYASSAGVSTSHDSVHCSGD